MDSETKSESLKERIRFYTEMLKVLSIFVLTVGGGVVGLLLKTTYTRIEEILLIAGAALEVIFLSWMVTLYLIIEKLLRRLSE